MRRSFLGLSYSYGTVSGTVTIEGPVVQDGVWDNHDFIPVYDGICGLVVGTLLMVGTTIGETVQAHAPRGEMYVRGVEQKIQVGCDDFVITLEATLYCDVATITMGMLSQSLEVALFKLMSEIIETVNHHKAERLFRQQVTTDEDVLAAVVEAMFSGRASNSGFRRNPSWLVLALQRGVWRLKSRWGAISD
jgi:hypothetical protein